jgi:hypothetical protein
VKIGGICADFYRKLYNDISVSSTEKWKKHRLSAREYESIRKTAVFRENGNAGNRHLILDAES